MSTPSENGDSPGPVRVLEGDWQRDCRRDGEHGAESLHGLPRGQFQMTCLCPYESAFTAALRHAGCEVYHPIAR